MSETFKVTTVNPQSKSWDSKFGPMVTYLVMVEGRELPVEMNKKPDSPAPQAGDELYGDINRTEYGDKFKSAQRPFGQSPSTSSGGSTRGGSGKPNFDNYTMYLSYAKDLARGCLVSTAKGVVFDSTSFAELLEAVAAGGAQLYEDRPGAEKPIQVSGKPAPLMVDGMEQLSATFGDIEVLTPEAPWNPGS